MSQEVELVPEEPNLAALMAEALNRGVTSRTRIVITIGFAPQDGVEYDEGKVMELWSNAVLERAKELKALRKDFPGSWEATTSPEDWGR
jgi:hypothetical protein